MISNKNYEQKLQLVDVPCLTIPVSVWWRANVGNELHSLLKNAAWLFHPYVLCSSLRIKDREKNGCFCIDDPFPSGPYVLEYLGRSWNGKPPGSIIQGRWVLAEPAERFNAAVSHRWRYGAVDRKAGLKQGATWPVSAKKTRSMWAHHVSFWKYR